MVALHVTIEIRHLDR